MYVVASAAFPGCLRHIYIFFFSGLLYCSVVVVVVCFGENCDFDDAAVILKIRIQHANKL